MLNVEIKGALLVPCILIENISNAKKRTRSEIEANIFAKNQIS